MAEVTPTELPLVYESRDELADLFAVWRRYIATGELGAGIRPVVREAWQRCAAYGVDPLSVRRQQPDPLVLSAAQECASPLLAVADPYIAAIHKICGDKPHLIALLDAEARVVRLVADARAQEEGRDLNLFEGASWAEATFGCNGGGTAIAAGKPVLFLGPEHLVDGYLTWTCIGAPIRDATGAIVGALDWSVPNDAVELASWGWMLEITRIIEEHLASHTLPDEEQVRRVLEARKNPFNVPRGVFELLGSQLSLLPTHRRILQQAEATLELAERTLQESTNQSIKTQYELATANQQLLMANAVAERRAREANAARREAEQAARERDQFVTLISHDLRNPLSALTMRVGLLQRRLQAAAEEPEPEHLLDGLSQIADQAARMERLVAELLDIARVRSGKPLSLKRQKTDLVALARSVVEEHRPNAPEHRIEVRPAAEAVVGEWDPRRLERVVGNLLANAVKYSPMGGRIVVDVEQLVVGGARLALLRITDAGIGIPAQDLPHVFEWFGRGSNGSARGVEGIGIGLAGAKLIVEQHGGSITAESSEGKGSTFTVCLPLD